MKITDLLQKSFTPTQNKNTKKNEEKSDTNVVKIDELFKAIALGQTTKAKCIINEIPPGYLGKRVETSTPLDAAIRKHLPDIEMHLIRKMSFEHLGIRGFYSAFENVLQQSRPSPTKLETLLAEKIPPEYLGVKFFKGTRAETTLLHLVLNYDKMDIAKLLIEKMSPEHLGIKNHEGLTCFQLAERTNNREIRDRIDARIHSLK